MITLKAPPYKGAQGMWLTSQLFHERYIKLAVTERVYNPIFTLSYQPNLISARDTFLALEDPTGYKWAMKYLGAWEPFTILLKAEWFLEYYSQWLDELEIALKARAIESIAKIALSATPQALPAAKYIAAGEWKKAAHGRGRPSREELKGELRKHVEALSNTNEDARRIGLTIVTGGKQ